MFDFDPFDMDMDGDIDGIDFLGFDHLMRYVLGRRQVEDEEDTASRSHSPVHHHQDENHDAWDHEEEDDMSDEREGYDADYGGAADWEGY